MQSASTLTHPVLTERLLPGRGLARAAGLCVAFSLFNAALAQVAVWLPFSPVPISGQTLAVLLTGAVLGPRLGFASLVLYLAEGAVGLPFFAGGAAGAAVLLGPTGGYLAGFPLAAALVGWLAARGWDRHPLRMAAAMVSGNAVIYALGLAWLFVVMGGPGAGALLDAGLLPFLPGDAAKIVVAMALLPGAWRLVGRRQSRRG